MTGFPEKGFIEKLCDTFQKENEVTIVYVEKQGQEHRIGTVSIHGCVQLRP